MLLDYVYSYRRFERLPCLYLQGIQHQSVKKPISVQLIIPQKTLNVQYRCVNLKYRIIYPCAAYGRRTNTLKSFNYLSPVMDTEFTLSVTNEHFS
jgi:hypothetical protein